jgi:hypothetical protein
VILPHVLNVEAGVSPASFDVAAAVLGCTQLHPINHNGFTLVRPVD